MGLKEEVKQLAFQVPRPPGEDLAAGVSDEAISQFEARTGLYTPPNLQDLRFTNGPCIGPGGVFGIRPGRSWLDLEGVLELYPSWRDRGWIPIAGDGCGNYYIINTKEGESVYFIDACVDDNCLTYAVASNLWAFLWFLFSRELGHSGWPFEEGYVVSVDPLIRSCASASLPWNVAGQSGTEVPDYGC